MIADVPEEVVAGAVAAARGYLRAVGEGEAAVLAQLARAAIGVGERFTGLLFVERAVEEVVAASGAWVPLRAEPVAAVEGVTGLPVGGEPVALAADAYEVEIDADGCGWVRVTRPGDAVRVAVRYRAGLAAAWDDVPAPIAQGVVALVAHLHDDRAGGGPPAAVGALWRPWRRLRLAGLGARA